MWFTSNYSGKMANINFRAVLEEGGGSLTLLSNVIQESVELRVNLRQIRLDDPYYVAFLDNRTTIALQNRQNLSSPN
jgi:hypothetical protein